MTRGEIIQMVVGGYVGVGILAMAGAFQSCKSERRAWAITVFWPLTLIGFFVLGVREVVRCLVEAWNHA